MTEPLSALFRAVVRLALPALAVLSVAEVAAAAKPKAMRIPLPAREVERPLILPRGWIEFDLDYRHKIAAANWDSEGNRQKWETARWTWLTESLTLRFGFDRRTELFWYIPFHQGHLVNEELGTDLFDFSFGDPKVGLRRSVYTSDEGPLTQLVFETELKGPAGSESPGTFIGGPYNMSQIVFTTGTVDWYLGLAAKRELGPLAVIARAGYMRRFSGVVQYVIELENYQFLGRIEPGDQLHASLELQAQLGPLVVTAAPDFTLRAATKLGTTTKGLDPGGRLRPVAGSGGSALDLRVGAQVAATRGLDLGAFASIPLIGEDLMFFPIEDIHPTLGPTFGGSIELRY